jgi:hypothetical protein
MKHKGGMDVVGGETEIGHEEDVTPGKIEKKI